MSAKKEDENDEDDEDDEDVKRNNFVKIEPKEEDETENWEDLVPQPKTALSGRKKFKPLKWGMLQVSYPWRELPEDADHKTMSLRADHLLEGLAAMSPQEDAVAAQIDLDVSNTRLKQASEMVQDIIEEQLKKRRPSRRQWRQRNPQEQIPQVRL